MTRGGIVARIGIIGSAGRMGQALAAAITDAGEALAGGVDVGGDPLALARDCDALVDFSSPRALEANLDAALEAGVPVVIGTTGLEERHHFLIDHAAERIAVLQTGNTSLGVTLLAHLVREAASRLGEDWDIEIVETHHRNKVDAPSGTALGLARAAAAGRGLDPETIGATPRDGHIGPRPAGMIGLATVHGGDVPGEHTVIFAGAGERLELAHRPSHLSVYARGAVRAARWLAAQKPGYYAMNDVLGLKAD